MTQPAYSDLERGESASSSLVPQIARALGVNALWLATGEGPRYPPMTRLITPATETDEALPLRAVKRRQVGVAIEGAVDASPILVWETEGDLPEHTYVFVPSLELELAAGSGRKAVHVDYKKPKAFLSDWIRDKGLRAKYLVSMTVRGDSMAPWVNEGDTVVIDRSNTAIRDGKPYAIRYGDELRIKHLHRRFDGGLILRSVNKAWDDEVIPPADLEHIEILGLVVWRAG